MNKCTLASLGQTIADEVKRFESIAVIPKLFSQNLTVVDYHKFLKLIFHQTFNAAATFALAAGFCDTKWYEARDYLIKHASEERTHWQWVLGDLEKTGYNGPDLRTTLPSPKVSAFIAFNFYVASKFPIARLANAAVLEGIGATYAKKFAKRLSSQLRLSEDQLVFIFGHSDTDVGHSKEIFDLLRRCELDSSELEWLSHSAVTSGMLYREMYNDEWNQTSV